MLMRGNWMKSVLFLGEECTIYVLNMGIKKSKKALNRLSLIISGGAWRIRTYLDRNLLNP